MLREFLFAFLIHFTFGSIEISSKIENYFNSDAVKSFANKWDTVKASYENAISTALRENFGEKALNVYVRRMANSNLLTKGFYTTDNVVNLLLLDMKIRDIPHLIMPVVNLTLASNFMYLKTGLENIYVFSHYMLFRNDSAVLTPSEMKQTNSAQSPFAYPQVHEFGEVVIVAQGCILSGIAVITLDGTSIDLGHNTFKVSDCQFLVEVTTPGIEAPPVVAPYFNQEQGQIIENLISKPLNVELLPKLQGVFYSYVNTSAVLGSSMKQYRKKQHKLVKETAHYMSDVVSALNKATIEKNDGWFTKDDASLRLKSVFYEKPIDTFFSMENVTIYGLDTAYSAHAGGAIKSNDSMKVVESIRFNKLQVKGKIYCENQTARAQQDFAVELSDVSLDVTVNLNSNNDASSLSCDIDFNGWRNMELSLSETELFLKERILTTGLVSGYIVEKLPKYVKDHVKEMLSTILTRMNNYDLNNKQENYNDNGKVNNKMKNLNNTKSDESETTDTTFSSGVMDDKKENTGKIRIESSKESTIEDKNQLLTENDIVKVDKVEVDKEQETLHNKLPDENDSSLVSNKKQKPMSLQSKFSDTKDDKNSGEAHKPVKSTNEKSKIPPNKDFITDNQEKSEKGSDEDLISNENKKQIISEPMFSDQKDIQNSGETHKTIEDKDDKSEILSTELSPNKKQIKSDKEPGILKHINHGILKSDDNNDIISDGVVGKESLLNHKKFRRDIHNIKKNKNLNAKLRVNM